MKYFAYGANLSVEVMKNRCRDAKPLGAVTVKDFRLMFKGEEPSAYATIEPWEGYSVPGVLWEISEADEKALDKFEGYPRHYLKSTVTVEFGGEKFLAMYYHKPEKERIGQPMTHYVAVLDEGYDKWKLDKNILKAALKQSDDYYQLG